ncbi:hypothetical protein ACGF7W_19690 [Streptomyces sp. NPDC048219]|uniref:hypothetical protein n=1 Tax=Streptomyces sp. NPDC048219 TaxID=3365517 RepID=UPI00371FF2AC
MSGFARGCESMALPHALTYGRPYLVGWRCARHTPAAEKGQPEAPAGPGWPIHRAPAPDHTEPSADDQEKARDHS